MSWVWAGQKSGEGCIMSNVVYLNFTSSVEGHTAHTGCEYLYTVMVGKCEGRKPFCRHWSTEIGNVDVCSKKCGWRVDWMEQYLDGD
jgi:hypothetical protein